MDAFQGFSEETISFLWGIRFNNNRQWFLDHKKDYVNYLYEPLKALAARMEARMADEFPALGLRAKTARIYRDVRRIHHGGPYKEHLWFVLIAREEGWSSTPAFYFEVMPEGYEFGMGYYQMTPATLEQYRRRILREPKPLETLARRLNRQDRFRLEGEDYKRSKGEVGPLLKPWFNKRQIEISAAFPPDERFTSPELEEDVMEAFRFLVPYYRYFKSLDLEPPIQ